VSVVGKSSAPNECEATLGYRLRFTHQEGTEEQEEATEKEEEEQEEETEMEAGSDLLTPPHCVILELDALLTPKCGFARQTGQQFSVHAYFLFSPGTYRKSRSLCSSLSRRS
jgi:hypothetical protein